MFKRIASVLAAAALCLAAQPHTASAQGFLEYDTAYGYFYGTFDENPNVALFAGGTIEEFCVSDPGTAHVREFLRQDGTVDLKVNDKDQPIYLYYTEYNDVPIWLGDLCPALAAGADVPEPFATGEADLKVRITVVTNDLLEIFNSVNGKATGVDGTEFKVFGSADLILENGVPLGVPSEFVGFKLVEIRR